MTTEETQPTSIIGSATIEATPNPALPHAVPDPSVPPAAGVEPEAAATDEPSPESVAALTLADLAAPEGLALEADGAPIPEAEEFLSLINEHKIPKAAADAVLAIYPKLLERVAGEYAGQWEATQADWQAQLRAEPVFGGPKLDASLSATAKIMDKYGDKELREALAVTGAGNHPAVFRFLAKIANDLNEAPPVSGSPAAPITRDIATRMFGNKGT